MPKAPRTPVVSPRAAIISLKPRRVGRPPAGPRGERVSDYAPVMIRLPQPTKDMLAALRAVSGMPVWQLVDIAVRQYVARMPNAERKLLADVKSRRARLAADS